MKYIWATAILTAILLSVPCATAPPKDTTTTPDVIANPLNNYGNFFYVDFGDGHGYGVRDTASNSGFLLGCRDY